MSPTCPSRRVPILKRCAYLSAGGVELPESDEALKTSIVTAMGARFCRMGMGTDPLVLPSVEMSVSALTDASEGMR